MRELTDVIDQLKVTISKNGQLTKSVEKGLESIRQSYCFSAPEVANEKWGELSRFMRLNFPDDNPHTPEYRQIVTNSS